MAGASRARSLNAKGKQDRHAGSVRLWRGSRGEISSAISHDQAIAYKNIQENVGFDVRSVFGVFVSLTT